MINNVSLHSVAGGDSTETHIQKKGPKRQSSNQTCTKKYQFKMFSYGWACALNNTVRNENLWFWIYLKQACYQSGGLGSCLPSVNYFPHIAKMKWTIFNAQILTRNLLNSKALHQCDIRNALPWTQLKTTCRRIQIKISFIIFYKCVWVSFLQ